ncbi:DUF423 domain-containing protein [Umezakia ovalisporum]|jgi:uncharacterized membrane protein YgdD (TMEM256/DUF423 family)|uniref:DUF423 domain-containing protein n=2 Tax=Umezakia ovalisporum TaxID=75695 RepID=A0AA43KFW8_9CYAN|nr:DUF423 domain-containing protein [Umezakia ovalisporum]MBI1242014.1 DUF423 domain-containing protein [Nostoc sp. RI_552]MDH6056621.1 DUF423 domain-containing protein [Umezakia ovalisporum FSS-43]MDH6065097.1 DUF423 domain-containing protein [Umezakia ovalisporum FSS-62]MDH6067286.1 DUF423 domain-containing protein [Umezakia ovalisporum APH033B]MDH6070196.1 DUF423 domain-containing protein [Umezakia ovalisporum CobakiLakeA]
MAQIFVSLAAVLGGLSVAAGAFASHALRLKVSEQSLEIFDIAARYQMYHALALLLVGLLISRTASPQPILVASGWSFVLGTTIFSGSLYALSLTGWKYLGAITPLGGVAFLVGWGALAVAGWGLEF